MNNACYFVVMTLKKKIGVEILGQAIDKPLSWADGMIGALPVFKTYAAARKWAGEKLEILVIKEGKDE